MRVVDGKISCLPTKRICKACSEVRAFFGDLLVSAN